MHPVGYREQNISLSHVGVFSVKKTTVRNARQVFRIFWHTRPASLTTEATAEIGVKIDTVALMDLDILSRCRKSLKACVLSCSRVVMSSME